jgi:hypothetical protein
MASLHSSPPVVSLLSPVLLIRAVQEVSAARSLDEIVGIVKRTARTGTGADGVSFVLRENDQCHYVDEDSIAPLWKGRRFPLTECISGWTMLHRQAVSISDITLDLRIPQDAYQPTFVRSLVMVPIRSSAPVGAIGAYWSEIRQFTPELVHWLQALADATSAGIEAVRANTEIEAVHAASRASNPAIPKPPERVKMCAWTKRFFHGGKWISIEAYLDTRYGVEVTHGMSEDALVRLKQEMSAVAQREPTSVATAKMPPLGTDPASPPVRGPTAPGV